MSHKVSSDTLREIDKLNKSIGCSTEFNQSKNVVVPLELGMINDKPIVVNIQKYLDFKTFGNFVASMAVSDFVEDEHIPQNGKIFYALKIVESYVPGLNLPEDIGEAYTLINELGIYDKVIEIVSETEQFNDLREAIRSAQEFEKTKKSGFNGLINTFKNVLQDFDIPSILEAIKGFAPEQLENLSELRGLANIFTEPQMPTSEGKAVKFPGVSGEDTEAVSE